ncbi:MAG: group II truncated hemoglobin [Gammaproteobacteria bacterium]|nr:group II truncated hemoglobin [Gammaproteobacteria bacterium]MBU1776000.1 group II truncated hemoglobin [Gammaproteobacteria bacterium]MBU1967581.1 group II truncated hemoglobin [Gammaproteobacteria bacterium]
MQISTDTRSHYERIGGEAKVRQLVQRFYQLMDALPEAHGVRKMHGVDLKRSEDKLFMFLSGWMNGPQLFIEKFGHPRLRQRHMPFAIGDTERDQWMMCMTQALQDVVEDEALRKELVAAFGKVADFMRNKA